MHWVKHDTWWCVILHASEINFSPLHFSGIALYLNGSIFPSSKCKCFVYYSCINSEDVLSNIIVIESKIPLYHYLRYWHKCYTKISQYNVQISSSLYLGENEECFSNQIKMPSNSVYWEPSNDPKFTLPRDFCQLWLVWACYAFLKWPPWLKYRPSSRVKYMLRSQNFVETGAGELEHCSSYGTLWDIDGMRLFRLVPEKHFIDFRWTCSSCWWLKVIFLLNAEVFICSSIPDNRVIILSATLGSSSWSKPSWSKHD